MKNVMNFVGLAGKAKLNTFLRMREREIERLRLIQLANRAGVFTSLSLTKERDIVDVQNKLKWLRLSLVWPWYG